MHHVQVGAQPRVCKPDHKKNIMLQVKALDKLAEDCGLRDVVVKVGAANCRSAG
jgi:hypothetical protein